jgi:hypothetical protein
VEGDERRPVGVAVLLVPDGNAVDLLVRHRPTMSDSRCPEPWLREERGERLRDPDPRDRTAQAVTQQERRALRTETRRGHRATDERFELGPHRLVEITIPYRRLRGADLCGYLREVR